MITVGVPSDMTIKELKEELEAAGSSWEQHAKMFTEVSLRMVVRSGLFQNSCRM